MSEKNDTTYFNSASIASLIAALVAVALNFIPIVQHGALISAGLALGWSLSNFASAIRFKAKQGLILAVIGLIISVVAIIIYYVYAVPRL